MALWNKTQAKKIMISTVIDNETRIEGDLFCTTPLKIDGTINGTVNATSEVVIGQNATINGDLFVHDVIISGIVNGDVVSNETVSLTEFAKVNGDITTTGLVVDSGCKFEGKCNIVEKIDKPTTSDEAETVDGLESKTVLTTESKETESKE